MAAFFKFILIIFIAIVIAIAVVVIRVYKRIHQAAQQIREQMGGEASQNQKRQHPYSGDDEIIDNRDPEKANQKIYSDNEGEYVDYEEK
jgi:cell division protein FtsL